MASDSLLQPNVVELLRVPLPDDRRGRVHGAEITGRALFGGEAEPGREVRAQPPAEIPTSLLEFAKAIGRPLKELL